MKNLGYLVLLIFFSQCKPKTDPTLTQFMGKPKVPLSIKKTHEHLLEQIHGMTFYKDSSSQAAIKLENFMLHHFRDEEDLILPLLGLLPSLTKDKIPEHSKEIIRLSENVKLELNHMSAEHQLIKAFMNELKQAAATENLRAIVKFENEVLKHASSEEEVFFPTSILIGDYLKLLNNRK